MLVAHNKECIRSHHSIPSTATQKSALLELIYAPHTNM